MGASNTYSRLLFPDVVKAVIGIAAIYVALEAAVRIGSAFVGMAGNPIFIDTYKNRIVIFRIFIEQARPDKGVHNLPIQKPCFQKIRINPSHVLILLWKGKRLFFPFPVYSFVEGWQRLAVSTGTVPPPENPDHKIL